ncbi:MAG: hypothetical protein ACR2ND_13385, partial [Solirubrobacteraceae bacterium]
RIGECSGQRPGLVRDALPLAPGVWEVAGQLGVDPGELAACGGEDYELCVCVAPAGREAAERAGGLTWIGRVAAHGSPGASFSTTDGPRELKGFEHQL